MGIRPKADGENIILTDTHRDLVDDVTATTDEFGTVLGEGINEIAATAQSANSGARELAGRVKSLEESVTVRNQAGVGAAIRWRRWGNVVTVTAPSAVDVAALLEEQSPAWARPDQIECVAAAGSTTGTAVFLRENGGFTITGPDTTVRFTLTFIVA